MAGKNTSLLFEVSGVTSSTRPLCVGSIPSANTETTSTVGGQVVSRRAGAHSFVCKLNNVIVAGIAAQVRCICTQHTQQQAGAF